MNCLFLSETIITAKLLFQQVCALSLLLITSLSGGSDGGIAVRNRWRRRGRFWLVNAGREPQGRCKSADRGFLLEKTVLWVF